nr:hypothetical protein [Tanacetum cinerariifolium]
MKGSDIRIQEKKAKLLNEWRNKHFPEKIASNLKFLNNLQLEWSRHVTIVHQTKDLHTTDYTQLYDFLKYNQKDADDLRAERLAKIQDPLALMATSNNPYTFPVLHQEQPSFNQNYMQQPMLNSEDITDPTTTMNMALALMAKAFKLTTQHQPTTTRGFHQTLVIGRLLNQVVQNVRNQNGLIVVSRIANQNPNGNVRPMRRDAAYLQTQLLIAQKEEAGIQLQAEEFDLMAVAADLDEIEEVNANCILMANLQQASTSEEQYTKLLEPIPEPHQVLQNDNNVISEVSSVEQSGRTVEQHPANVEETRALYDSLYNNLAVEVEKVNTVNRKLR